MGLRPRALLAVLLAVSGVLFLIGSTSERHHRAHETLLVAPTTESPAAKAAKSGGESAAAKAAESGGEAAPAKSVESGGESAAAHAAESPAHRSSEVGARILGVDTESLGLSILAVVASALLAIAVVAGVLPRPVLALTALFGAVFAAGDIREILHQIDESNGGLAAIAGVLIALHLVVAALALALLGRGRPRVPAATLPGS
jgi:hypothetical protein